LGTRYIRELADEKGASETVRDAAHVTVGV